MCILVLNFSVLDDFVLNQVQASSLATWVQVASGYCDNSIVSKVTRKHEFQINYRGNTSISLPFFELI